MMKTENIIKEIPEFYENPGNPAIEMNHFHVWFRGVHILKDFHIQFHEKKMICIIGPSGSGKSTMIRSINRINDDVDGFTYQGNILFHGHMHGQAIYQNGFDVNLLRTKIGMVFQKPCVFPRSISDNVLFGVKHIKKLSKQEKQEIVEKNLRAVSLWDEVSFRLQEKASSLSIGQQQRLCIARTLAVKPSTILLDEPTSSLDPISTNAIENLLLRLKERYTILFVTHNILQAKRIADYIVFVCEGRIIEHGPKEKLFSQPEKQQTRDYLNTEYCEC
ncbi:MAG: phosphate ABC transporter ATP-binding protein [Candidatus Brocadiaceae bacterium]|nr:phosphate ABC transporter ATP-binding protein [Candidatus Brocadiaceae bacterium]